MTHGHDDSLDLIAVDRPVGVVYWDKSGVTPGLVLRVGNGDDRYEDLPDSGQEAAAMLRTQGYALDEYAIAQIDALVTSTSNA